MPSFHNGAVEIAYLDEGEGDPIVLVHGFASTKNVNWVYPTWVSELKKNGRRVIALDNRGHGDSAKLYDPEAYHIGTMAGDVGALMDHLNIERADMMGYSLGARMTAWLAHRRPQRVRSAIFGGIGIGLIEGGGPGENVAEALEAPSLDEVTDPVGRTFRAFADQTFAQLPMRLGELGEHQGFPVERRAAPPDHRERVLEGARGLLARLAALDDQRGGRRDHCAGIDRGRHQGRNCGLGASARKNHPGFKSARHSQPRSHAGGRRQGLQRGRAGFSLTAKVTYRSRTDLICSNSQPSSIDSPGEGEIGRDRKLRSFNRLALGLEA